MSFGVVASLIDIAGKRTEVHQIGVAQSRVQIVIIPGNPGAPT